MDLLKAAEDYSRAGLCVLPAYKDQKRPAIRRGWDTYKSRKPTAVEIKAWFANRQDGLCVLCGEPSGGLELMDFDGRGELFEPWKAKVEERAPGLPGKLFVEESQSKGIHVAYLSEAPICGNLKLAQRRHPVRDDEITLDDEGREWVTICGKKYAVREDAEGKHVILTLIETRGQGGLFLAHPTPGYDVLQGDLCDLPVLTEEERDVLLMAAWELNEHVADIVDGPRGSTHTVASGESDLDLPGTDFNRRGDVRSLLEGHGWVRTKGGENEYWRRPGKDRGHSATLKVMDDGVPVFYVFSANAHPFDPGEYYKPFAVYAFLEHGKDFSAAASALRAQGYGSAVISPVRGVDLSQFIVEPPGPEDDGLPQPLSLGELVRTYPALRPPVIHGLLREGETMNVIAPPKAGKSWLVNDLALAVATGRPFLGTFPAEQGDVLIIDNELHKETSAHRLPKVAMARGIPLEALSEHVFVQNLRGQLKDLLGLGAYFAQFEPGRFKVIILDAFYRFLPMKADENDNGTMANLHNYLDAFAERLKCCFVLIHHTSKGNQSQKGVTDVGAGAGSQSRATDTHLILRQHEEDNAVVLDAVVRSWPPVKSLCLRWDFPLWYPAEDLDPEALKGSMRVKRSKPSEDDAQPSWNVASFVDAFLDVQPKSEARIMEDAEGAGLSSRRIGRFLALAEEDALIHRWTVGPKAMKGFATVEQPEDERAETSEERVARLIAENPDLTTREIADECDLSRRRVQQIRRDLVAEPAGNQG